MEDWQFVTGPAVAEISGDALPEIIATSGGYFVHAFNAAGVEPAGWPKLTGQWQTADPVDRRPRRRRDCRGGADDPPRHALRVADGRRRLPAGPVAEVPPRRVEHAARTAPTPAARRRIDDLDFDRGRRRRLSTWTAPGDDGRCGTATAYELRASATPISGRASARATPVAIRPAARRRSGGSTLIDRRAGARFFALRAVDEAGNAGPLALVAVGASVTTTSAPRPSTSTSTSTSTTLVVPTTSTTSTTLAPLCTPAETAACDDGNLCTVDRCEPGRPCVHEPRPATEPGGVTCAVDSVRVPVPSCTGRCRCRFDAALDRIARLVSDAETRRPVACRRALNLARRRAAALDKRIGKLGARGCLADTGPRLIALARELAARARVLADGEDSVGSEPAGARPLTLGR